MSNSAPTVRMTKAATLRAAKNAPRRQVGKEATKPKPSPAPRVTPPSYAQQDAETGEQDATNIADDIIDEEDAQSIKDEKTEERTPAPAPKKGPVRSKTSESRVTTSTFKATPKAQGTASLAPHMSVLSLVSDYKPVPGKPAKATEYYPSFFHLYGMHSAVASLLSPIKAIHKADPTYNTVFSRLALSYCVIYIILCARKASNLLTYEENKVLKKLETSYDMDSIQIPGPYVLLLSSFGFHTPADARFDVVCPALPAEQHLKSIPYTYNSAHMSLFPHFPSLLYLANLVASGEVEESDEARNDADDANEGQFNLHWQNGEFVVVETDHNNTNGFRYWNRSVRTKADKKAHGSFLMHNAALIAPFYEKKSNLKNVADNLPISSIPFPPQTDNTVPDLMSYFGVKGSTRWLPVIFESLEFESKFFKGTVSLRDIGFESGQNILCVTNIKLTADADETDWFPENRVEPDGHSVYTKMENVSDGDMAIAAFAQTVVFYEGGHILSFLRGEHSIDNSGAVPKNEFNPFNSHTRKIIREVPTLSHRFRTHIKTEMLLDAEAVLTNL